MPTTNDIHAQHGTPTIVKGLSAFRQRLTTGDWRSIFGMYGTVIFLHVLGFVILLVFVAPKGFAMGGDHAVFTVGVGVLAYTLGLRHAFDADHIAFIDNATRKLMADNLLKADVARYLEHSDHAVAKPVDKKATVKNRPSLPLSVGFWFSLGHSTIVFALIFLLGLGVKALVGPVENEDSQLHNITGIIGASVSGIFLWIIGGLNLIALIGIIRVFRKMRQGTYDDAELEKQLNSRGFMNRILGGLTKTVSKPWNAYPVGVLFGLGFDTATEVGLLVVAGGAAALDLPFYSIIVLPVLFAAGMCLMDTTDGIFMNAAYGWAFAKPVRKVFYNMTITSISVMVALVIGTIELISVLADQLHLSHGPLAWIADINLDYAGYAVVGLFFLVWLIALAVWHFGHVEDRWSSSSAPS